MQYRKEIDGLRAVAVVPVILFHAGYSLFSGGYVGVDVFFVISGYLITSILLNDIEEGRFSILKFYERRARRILPAFVFIIASSFPFSWLLMQPSQFEDFLQSIFYANIFLSNFYFWKNSGYFAPAAEEMPLLHTWSLSVEEQYYVFFPLLLFLLWRYRKKTVLPALIFCLSVSFALSEWGWRNEANANFYLTPTRIWEILAGSCVAVLTFVRNISKSQVLSIIGLLMILSAIFLYDDSIPFPSYFTLLPVIGTCLIILFAQERTVVSNILSYKLLVGIGLISYSLYLWHQPVFALFRIFKLEPVTEIDYGALIALVAFLSYLTWRFVERPFRNCQAFTQVQVLIGSTIIIVAVTTTSLYGLSKIDSFESHWLSKKTEAEQRLFHMVQRASGREANVQSGSRSSEFLSDCRFDTSKLDVDVINKVTACREQFGSGILILGDSHAVDLFGMVVTRFDNPFIIGLTSGGCRPHTKDKECQYDQIANFISENNEIFSHVIFEQAGFYLFQLPSGEEGSRKIFEHLALTDDVGELDVNSDFINENLSYLRVIADHVPVTWFAPRIEPHINLNYVLEYGCGFNWNLRPQQEEVFELLDRKISSQIHELSHPNLAFRSQIEQLAFDFSRDLTNCSEVFWSDGDHFSSYGEARFGARLADGFLDFQN